MPKSSTPPKRYCKCCDRLLPARTERRHRKGYTPARLIASRLSSIKKHILKPVKKVGKAIKNVARQARSTIEQRSRSPPACEYQQLSDGDGEMLVDEPGVGMPTDDNSEMPRDVGRNYDPQAEALAQAALSSVKPQRSARCATVEDVTDDEDSDGDDSGGDSDSEPEAGEGSDDGNEDFGEEEWRNVWAEFEDELTDEDITMLRAFTLKVEDHLSDATYDRFQHVFPSQVPTYKSTKSRVRFLSVFNPVPYDCCIKSCCAYTGELAEEDKCPHCQEPRRNSKGRPRKRFMYMPFTSRLVDAFKNPKMAEQMRYRDSFTSKDGIIMDVFDGSHYQSLRKRHVSIGDQELRHKYFEDPHDIALGLSTDGFSPFKRRKHTAWPLILFNYNLPPEIRFWLIYIICIGVIPGPKKPKDFDSFLYPMVEEFLKLLSGVDAYDISDKARFMLRAFLILVFGDMPAISMVMRMKGHNGVFPCRMCLIEGLCVPDSRATTHYCPLERAQHPSVIGTENIRTYDAANLPLRSHDQFMEQARHVQFADSSAEMERRSRDCGIKGVPILSALPSLDFPGSFPLDFMHLMYENTIKNLISLWTGKFKDLDEGDGDYEFENTVWDAIGKATEGSGSTIPSAYGARPQNIALPGISCTADAWSFWSLYIGPVLLRGRFKRQVYYKHFIELVRLIHLCLKFEYTRDDINHIRAGFQSWVKRYEELYYQYSPDRLPTCPTTIHSLLHIADGIEKCGPVWAYWAFPMERFCGILLPCIKSRRFPFANLDSHVLAVAQLTQIKNRFNIHDKLRLRPQKDPFDGVFSIPSYPTCVLVHPRVIRPSIPAGLLNKIVICLATRYEKDVKIVRKFVKVENITAWGKVRRLDGGDTMNASSLVKTQEDSRDATHVRYELLVDKNANRPNAPVEFVPDTFYGQLQNIWVVKIPASRALNLEMSETLILAAVRLCKIERRNDLDMHYFREYGVLEVVDITTIQCLVGRIRDRNFWAIIDRSGDLARPVFDINDV